MLVVHGLRRVCTKAALAAAVCLVCGGAALAQTTSATVSGSVKDAHGGVLPGATVTLMSETKGTMVTATTGEMGDFVFPYVPPDTYTLKIALPGFQSVQRSALVVNANDRIMAGLFTLAVGQLAETLTVAGQSSEIQLKGGERGLTLQLDSLRSFAVAGRSLFGLAVMVPGVVPNTAGPTAVDGFNVNGQRANSNNMTIDGVANIDTGNNGGNMVQSNLDAIAEYKVLTSSYQAEYGRAVGGQVQVVTKSGSRDFRGSAYWYGRRSAWNANTWTNNRDGIPMAESSRNEMGYTIGGPVFIPGHFNADRQKLFFFWNQEFQRRQDPVSEARVTVPTALERTGDFSQSVDANGNPWPYIRDYATGLPCSASNTSGCFRYQGVLGRIDPSRLYAPTLAALSLFPAPNVSGRVGYNYSSQTPSRQPLDQVLLRGDYQVNDAWRVTGRFMKHSNRNELPYGVAGWSLGSNLDIVNVVSNTPGLNWLGTATAVLSNTMSLEISFGSAHNSLDHSSGSENFKRAYLAGLAAKTGAPGGTALPMLNTTAIQDDYIPTFVYGGGRILNQPVIRTAQAPFTNFNTTYDGVANLTKAAGAHTLKAGLYYQKSLKDQSAFASFNGQYNFNNDANNPYDSQHPFANAALGIYQSFSQVSAYAKPKWRYTNVEWYVQDNWRATGKLTLDYGVRFYYLTPQWDVSKTASNWLADKWDAAKAPRLYQPAIVNGVRVGYDAATGRAVAAAFIGRIVPDSGDRFNGAYQAGQGISDTLTDGSKFRVSPRAGFAYDITGKQRMVARGGFAVLYDRPQGNQVFDLINNPPGLQAQVLTYGLVSQVGQGGTTPLYSPLALYPDQYDWTLPRVYQWNLAFQAQLPAQFVLDVAYVGSKSDYLLQYRNLNGVPYGRAYDAAYRDPTRGQTCAGCSALSATPGANALTVDFLRPYAGFGDIRLWEFAAYSSYKALQTTVSRRLSKGLMFSAYYAWSSAKGTLGGDWDYARIDGKDREANYGPLWFDVPHMFQASVVYRTPPVTSGGLRFLTNDWQISGSYVWRYGTPVTAAFSIPGIGNVNLTGSYTENARIAPTGDPISSGWSDDPYRQFNVAAFTAPQPGSIGLETPRYTMRGPTYSNINLSVSKSLPLGGSRRFEVRLDAFNAFNSVQWSGVNRTLNVVSLTNHTVTNLPYDASGNLVNKYGVGTISSVMPARQLQLMTRFTF